MERLRAKEAIFQLVVGGVRQTDLLYVVNFDLKPTTDKTRTKFTGLKRASNDLMVDGYEFSWQNHERSASWWSDVWKLYEKAELNGTEFPVSTIIVTKRYRRAASLTIKLFGELIITPDGNSHSGHDHVPVDWTGVCQYAT